MQTLILIFPVIISCLVAFVAWQQWQVAQNKLRLDLFDRRYKVFEAARKFVSQIISNGKFNDRDLMEFNVGTSDTKFLFGSDVVGYLEKLRENAIDIRHHQKLYENLAPGSDRSYHVEAEHDQLLWFTRQFECHVMTNTFAPYLDFSYVKIKVFTLR